MRAAARVTAGLAAIAGSIAVVSVAGSASADADGSGLARVRAATAKYHDVDVAAAPGSGYTLLGAPCFESAAGGMGIHYTTGGPDGSQFDNEVEAAEPEALVYEVTADGRKRLVAVEYIATGVGADDLTVLGQPLHRLGDTPLYILHAWVWRSNPDGMFADYNPKVGPCP